MAQERVAYIDGETLPESQAKISIRDAGFTPTQRTTLYEILKVY